MTNVWETHNYVDIKHHPKIPVGQRRNQRVNCIYLYIKENDLYFGLYILVEKLMGSKTYGS